MYEKDDVQTVFDTRCSIKEISADKTIVEMMSEAGGTAQLMLAAYNKGEPIKAAVFDAELKNGISELPFELPEGADTLRLFVWDSSGTPLSRPDIMGIN